ncbi:Glycine--tRNA ligase [Acholeplasma oculi]|uniref:Glycine--tRNA ligase n=1 Tax=Acholeplasma oculi TaxID=35623 RepID=A0A061AGB6_9MOLU|nr:glycine--tRNA ligase [Acholeplasma oculi]CDR30606.1 Glycyl-tRNA ligase [Acholeplasma oculi]SKC46406.1 glycyl-tRNA synthetase [Acholeplasma oculi]SUT89324.1 Glycine--tRNA ligase [Acholeplasma oculi]
MVTLEYLVQYAKQTGFIFQGSEIYGGLANTWDYGPLGVNLKKNIKEAWTKKFLRQGPNIVGLDSSILLNPMVWQASGHLQGFSDPLIENRQSNQRYRADKLILAHDPTQKPDGWTYEEMYDYIMKHQIKDPVSKTHDWLPIRKFNMMFKTFQGVIEDTASEVYLRPETAQGIFINFKNIQRATRKKVPFGVAQIGKSFRNEITPGNFIFRTREFEQMELEFFCKPGTELEWFDFWLNYMQSFLTNLGIKKEYLRAEPHAKEALSHYSNATTDIEFKYPWGFDELWGLASRTSFDLTQHMNLSKEDLTYLDPETNERYVPYVVEPAVGVERLALVFLFNGLEEETLEGGDSRQLLKIHPALAPYKAAILPLVKKEHGEKANLIYEMLAESFDVVYDETQNIGKRYRRQDAIGTPFCITVDHQTMTDETVTIRHRDSMLQERMAIKDLESFIRNSVKF